MFLRGLPKVVAKMRRPQKGETTAAKELGQHPDFYKISLFAPLPELEDDKPADKESNKEASKDEDDDDSSPSTPTVDKTPSEKGTPIASSPTSPAHTKITAASSKGASVPSTPGCNKSESLSNSPSSCRPMPTMATSEFNQVQVQLPSPNSFVGGDQELIDMSGSPGASIHSWNSPHLTQHELMAWPNTNSPTSRDGMSVHPSPIESGSGYYSNHFFQVTPPGMQRNSPHRATQHQRQRGQEEADSSGLSAADLCYLTQQNRILLQSQGKLPS